VTPPCRTEARSAKSECRFLLGTRPRSVLARLDRPIEAATRAYVGPVRGLGQDTARDCTARLVDVACSITRGGRWGAGARVGGDMGTPPPAFTSYQQCYDSLRDAEFWEPYVHAVLARHGVPLAPAEAGFVGQFPTFLVGEVVVKLFRPAPQTSLREGSAGRSPIGRPPQAAYPEPAQGRKAKPDGRRVEPCDPVQNPGADELSDRWESSP
jgi:hypothetical protein